MKRFIAIIIALLPMVVMAQSVMGIPFGSSIDKVKEILNARCGTNNVWEDYGKLYVLNPQMGAFEFNLGEFGFQRDAASALNWFNSADFQKHYDLSDKEIATSDRDFLYSLIKHKYKDDIYEYVNDSGFKSYFFGIDPKDDTKYLGHLYLSKGKDRKGEIKYHLILHYGPIYFLDKSADF